MQTNKPLAFGSLFAGIGGIDLGLERAGMVCKWQVEIDDYATRVLQKHWPDVTRFRDVRDCGAWNLEPVDLVTGGFPCQDISAANPRGDGIKGKRSGLWSEFHRIICELRPRYVLVENVSALLHRGMGTVLGDLAACGYDAEWQSLPAAAFGAPHIRDRVFILAYPGRYEQGRQCIEGRQTKERASVGRSGENVADAKIFTVRPRLCESQSSQERGRRFGDGSGKRNPWAVEPNVGRVADGVPLRVDRLRVIGNAVVPQVTEWIGRRIMALQDLPLFPGENC